MGGHGHGEHGEVDFENARVPDSAVIGNVGDGFRLALVRLGPARLTHCMRWLGVAQRAMDIATEYAKQRTAFGKKLTEQQSIQWMIADSEIALYASRLMVNNAAWEHENGSEIGTSRPSQSLRRRSREPDHRSRGPDVRRTRRLG